MVLEDLNTSPSRESILRLLICAGLLAFILYVYHSFGLEGGESAIEMLSILFGGFLVHSVLPKRFRQYFFIGLFFVTLFVLFSFVESLFVMILVFVSFGILHSFVPHSVKLVAFVIFGMTLLGRQMDIIAIPVPKQAITVFGGLFMFRIFIYLYDLKHMRSPVPWRSRLSYFLIPHNILFPLFPIVDFKLFQRAYYNGEDTKIYFRGIQMLIRGILHLVLYRFIYLYIVPSLNDVDSILVLFKYVVFSYTLILRLSGIFHMLVGLLCLFGYNLPDAFNNYFLANGFDDYWRRINVYWKDFILKVFYYPVYFKFKKLKPITAAVLTTVIIFIINWFLHSYQWIWITGKYTFSLTDVLFWSIFGALVIFSILLQGNREKKKYIHSPIKSLKTALTTLMTFSVSALLWSLWTSPTLNDWFLLLSYGKEGSISEFGTVAFILLGVLFIGSLFDYLYKDQGVTWLSDRTVSYAGKFANFCVLFILVALSSQDVRAYLNGNFAVDLNPLISNELNEDGNAELFEGYYDEILKNNHFGASAHVRTDLRSQNWVKLKDTGILDPKSDPLMRKMLPNQSIIFKGSTFTTNDYGLRDKSYELSPQQGVTRFAVVGSSLEMGSGVSDHEVFEQVLEDKLNLGRNSIKYEIINFALSGNSLLHHVYTLKRDVLDFEPDYLMLYDHDREWESMINFIKDLKRKKDRVTDFPELDSLLYQVDLPLPLSNWGVRKILEPFKEAIFSLAYSEIAETCLLNDVKVLWIHIPSVPTSSHMHRDNTTIDAVKSMATKNNFKVIDLSAAFDAQRLEDIRIASDDNHPNNLGHEFLANHLYDELMAQVLAEDE